MPRRPPGPFRILDIVGLQTACNLVIMDPRAKQEDATQHKIATLLKDKIDKGDTGVAAGKGFYDYAK